jgi:hypothetical protein
MRLFVRSYGKHRLLSVTVVLAFVLSASVLPVQGEPRPGCLGKSPTIRGTGRNDLLRGTSRNDVIVGRDGDDTILGLGGRDVICGGEGGDVLLGGAGPDLMGGGEGANLLAGFGGDDRLIAGPGPGDRLVGGDGDDRLDGGEGGFDLAFFLLSPKPVQADLGASVATGEGTDTLSGIEDLAGSGFDDSLVGDGGSNLLRGGPGNDALAGGEGDDYLWGGPGDDRLDGGAGLLDTVSYLDVPAPVQVDLAAGTATGDGNDVVVGTELLWGTGFDDIFWGDEGPNHIEGWFGVDELYGRGGNDRLTGLGGGLRHGGPGIDACYGGQTVECEALAPHGDPPPLARTLEPRDEDVIDSEAFSRVSGNRAFFGELRVALRRTTANGCHWWKDAPRRFVSGHCVKPVWNRAAVSRDGTWGHRFGKTLPAGWYELTVSVGETTEFRLV